MIINNKTLQEDAKKTLRFVEGAKWIDEERTRMVQEENTSGIRKGVE